MEMTRTPLTPLRALATECLPFELPLEMGNHWFYEWLEARVSSVNVARIRLRPRGRHDLLLLAVVGDLKLDRLLDQGGPKEVELPSFVRSWRAPATFRVRRDRTRVRDLELLSLRSQLNIAFLYYSYKDVLLHYTGRDESSLRRPLRTNAYGKHPSTRSRSAEPSTLFSVEVERRQLGTFNSYFVYADFAFVGQFYDSHRWHALEARWQVMRRLDVANCFRSIYTHSASWSTGTDFFSKKNLGHAPEHLGQQLDAIMQSANWGETHGICVGPEFSRVFAEVVFQHLGIEMESRIANAGISRRDYEILRYVDDYFIFASNQAVLDAVTKLVDITLTEHKFSINASKTEEFTTPFTTSISARKARLKTFLKSALPYDGDLPSLDPREISVHMMGLDPGSEKGSPTVGATLTHVERRLSKFMYKRAPLCSTRYEAEQLSAYAWIFVHSMLFQYLSHPSVSSSMKLVRALRMYSLAVDTFAVNESTVKVLRFRADEYVSFAVQKAIDRLLDVENSEIEICHFLSLAAATGVQFGSTSRLMNRLIERVSGSVSSPRGDQSGVFLLLAVMKYVFNSEDCAGPVRDRLIEAAGESAARLLGRAFLPTAVASRHAVQETFVLAILGCPFLNPREKFRLLDHPWLLDMVGAELYKVADCSKTRRFLRRALKDQQASARSRADDPSVFSWQSDAFDSLLYEKQLEFVY